MGYDIDHTFFTIEYFRKDKYFPKYLHVLTRKDGDSIDDEEEKWEGHLKKLQREMKNNAKKLKKELKEEMSEMQKELKEMSEKIENITEKIENNSKELKKEMSEKIENITEKIENNSKEVKEMAKRQEHMESKLDQLLELLSKSQNPD